MKHFSSLFRLTAILGFTTTCLMSLSAQTITRYNDLSGFESACGALSAIEDFQGSGTSLFGTVFCDLPISSSETSCVINTNSVDFASELTEGYTLSTSSGNVGIFSSDLIITLPSDAAGAGSELANTTITFDPNVTVTAVAFDIMAALTLAEFNIDIEIFGSTSSLGIETIAISNATPSYFAISSTEPIDRIVITGVVSDLELIDNLTFGECVMTSPVPTVGQWGLVVLGLIIASIGLVFMLVSKTKEVIA